MAHSVPGFINPLIETRLQFYSKVDWSLDGAVEENDWYWSRLCLSRMIVWGKKRRKGLKWTVQEKNEHHWNVAADFRACNTAKSVASLCKRTTSRSFHTENREQTYVFYLPACSKKTRVLDSAVLYYSANVSWKLSLSVGQREAFSPNLEGGFSVC